MKAFLLIFERAKSKNKAENTRFFTQNLYRIYREWGAKNYNTFNRNPKNSRVKATRSSNAKREGRRIPDTFSGGLGCEGNNFQGKPTG